MAVLINLLPDIKQERLKAQKHRRFTVGIMALVVIVAVVIPVLLLVARSTQTVLINRTQTSINKNLSQLQNTPNIETILTTQAHLKSLPSLYSQRFFPSQFFAILPNALPTTVRLSGIEMGTAGNVKFNAVGGNYAAAQKFVAALDALEYTPSSQVPAVAPNTPGAPVEPTATSVQEKIKLFNSVTLDSISNDTSGGGVIFIISANYDPGINNAKTN